MKGKFQGTKNNKIYKRILQRYCAADNTINQTKRDLYIAPASLNLFSKTCYNSCNRNLITIIIKCCHQVLSDHFCGTSLNLVAFNKMHQFTVFKQGN